MKHTIDKIWLGDIPQTLTGTKRHVGEKAPGFIVTDNNMRSYRFPQEKGKIHIISAVSSLDTPICDRETRRFNEEASALGEEVVILTISRDLPFAQKRWCAAAGIDRVKVLSDYRNASFGKKYGVLISESRLLARAVFITDRENVIRYREIVDNIDSEPDYHKILSELKKLL